MLGCRTIKLTEDISEPIELHGYNPGDSICSGETVGRAGPITAVV